MSVFFPVARYMGESVEDYAEGVNEVMSLKELHRLAEERYANSIIKRKREQLIESGIEPKVNKQHEINKSSKKHKLCPNKEDEVEEADKRNHSDKNCDDNIDDGSNYEDPLPILTHAPQTKSVSSVQYQLPQWATQCCHIEEDIVSHSQPIKNFSLHSTVINNLAKIGVIKFFPVQCKVIPEIINSSQGPLLTTKSGHRPSDMCICAPTGCGKTLSYVVPIISSLMTLNSKYLRALIVVPSKDLALQVHDVFKKISKGTGVRIGLLCSLHSVSIEQESIVSLFCSEVDVLVATPGRLVTHLEETPSFSLAHLRYLIIDEADRIFEEEYQSWLSCVLQAATSPRYPSNDMSSLLASSSLSLLLPKRCTSLDAYSDVTSTCTPCDRNSILQPFQKFLLSATLSLNPEHLSLLQLHRPKLFSVAPVVNEQLGETILPSTLREYIIHCSSDFKPLSLLHLILTFDHRKMLCFTHSCESTHRLSLLLQQYNAPVAEISSKSSLGARNDVIHKLIAGKIKVKIGF